MSERVGIPIVAGKVAGKESSQVYLTSGFHIVHRCKHYKNTEKKFKSCCRKGLELNQ